MRTQREETKHVISGRAELNNFESEITEGDNGVLLHLFIFLWMTKIVSQSRAFRQRQRNEMSLPFALDSIKEV